MELEVLHKKPLACKKEHESDHFWLFHCHLPPFPIRKSLKYNKKRDFNVRKKSKETTICSPIWHVITTIFCKTVSSLLVNKNKRGKKPLKIIREMSAKTSNPENKTEKPGLSSQNVPELAKTWHAINKLHFGSNETTAQAMCSRKQHGAFQQNSQLSG